MMPNRCAVAVACIFATSAVCAQSSTAQKAGATQGAATAQKPVTSSAQQSSSSQQDCGKPNAQGVTVLCPGNKAPGNPANAPGSPSGIGLGVSSGMPNANPLGTGSSISRGAAAQPSAEELAKKLKDEKSKSSQAKGKEVGPEHFSREQQLKDLAKGGRGVDVPAPGAANQQAGRGLETKDVHGNTTSSSKSAADLAKEAGSATTVSRDAGRNNVSRQEQQSSLGGPAGSDAAKAYAFGEKMRVERDASVGRSMRSDGTMAMQRITLSDGSGTRQTFDAKGNSTGVETIPPDPNKTRPNPEATAGGSTKTPEQYEAERKRQVTLPSDNQRRSTERVTVSAETARQLGAGGNTSGNITPADGGGSSNAPGKKPTRGIEKVDGTPGGGGAGTGPGKTGQ